VVLCDALLLCVVLAVPVLCDAVRCYEGRESQESRESQERQQRNKRGNRGAYSPMRPILFSFVLASLESLQLPSLDPA
jgi:hypothetical protein